MFGRALLDVLRHPATIYGGAVFLACSGKEIHMQFEPALPGNPMVFPGLNIPGRLKGLSDAFHSHLSKDGPEFSSDLLGDMFDVCS